MWNYSQCQRQRTITKINGQVRKNWILFSYYFNSYNTRSEDQSILAGWFALDFYREIWQVVGRVDFVIKGVLVCWMHKKYLSLCPLSCVWGFFLFVLTWSKVNKVVTESSVKGIRRKTSNEFYWSHKSGSSQ